MPGIRYIQAGDLHLGAPFSGIGHDSASPELARLLQEAAFIALERLVGLCESLRPDFLVLTGSLCKRGEAGLHAWLRLRGAFQRLEALELPVYIAPADGDPCPISFQDGIFPSNVHIFAADAPETFDFLACDGRRALVHGLGGGIDHGTRKLAGLFQRREDDSAFQLAVLPWTVENTSRDSIPAPSSLADLKNSGMDAWALGQTHDNAILCDQPFIASSASVQGLDISERGRRGCLLIQADKRDGAWRCSHEFHALAPVRWTRLHLDMEQAAGGGLEKRLGELLQGELEEADPAVSAIIARLVISGGSDLDSWLRKEGSIEDLRRVFASHSCGRAICALKDVQLESRDEGIWRESMAREDLLGESMRVYAALAENSANLQAAGNEALAPLLKYPQLADIAQTACADGLPDLLFQAENLCMDVLEKR